MTSFREFLRIDLTQSSRTIESSFWILRNFLGDVNKPLSELTDSDVRGYLSKLRATRSPKTYNNTLCALKRFFRDFLKRPDLVESFRFVKITSRFVEVPTREQLQRFFAALETDCDRALFLFYATTGLRRNEALTLQRQDVDNASHKVDARQTHENYSTKNAGTTFYNDETAEYLRRFLSKRTDANERIFPISENVVRKHFKKAERKTGVSITPQKLRNWFCQNMGELGVPDRFVDAFCGRVPASVLARRYTDYRPERLKTIYDKAGIRVL